MIESISLSRIDLENRDYQITSSGDFEDLGKSIETIGLINPPVVRRFGDRYTLICGFKRIMALMQCGIEKAEVKVIPEGEDADLKSAILAVSSNAFERPLTVMEQVRGVMLLKHHMDDRQIAEISASVFNTRMNPDLVSKLAAVGSLGFEIGNLIETGKLSMTGALKLVKFPDAAVEQFAVWFSKIRMSLNKQVEVITLAHEIAARESLKMTDLMLSDDIGAIINSKEMDETQKGNQLRTYLAKRRYPELSKAQEQFAHQVKVLNFGPELNINPPANFEGRDYTLSFRFQTVSDLIRKTMKLTSITENPEIRNLIQ